MQQVLGWSALKTGFSCTATAGTGSFGRGSRRTGGVVPAGVHRRLPMGVLGHRGDQRGRADRNRCPDPPEQLQHDEESAAVAWATSTGRPVLLPPPHQDRTRMFGTHVQQNT